MLIHDDFIYVLKMATFQFAANTRGYPPIIFDSLSLNSLTFFCEKQCFKAGVMAGSSC